MKSRIQLLWIDYCCAPAFGLVPFLGIYALFLIIGKYSSADQLESNYLLLFQGIIPLFAVVLPTAHFQQWFDVIGAEAMRACRRGVYSCVPEVLLLYVSFIALCFPLLYFSRNTIRNMQGELLRMLVQIAVMYIVYYCLCVFLNNITVSFMFTEVYILFCITACRIVKDKRLVLFRPDIWYEPEYGKRTLFPFACVSVLLLFLSRYVEKRYRHM